MSCPLEHTNALFGKYSFTLAVGEEREREKRQTGRHVRWCAPLLFRYRFLMTTSPAPISHSRYCLLRREWSRKRNRISCQIYTTWENAVAG